MHKSHLHNVRRKAVKKKILLACVVVLILGLGFNLAFAQLGGGRGITKKYGNFHWKAPVDSQSDLPSTASLGDARIVEDEDAVYHYDGSDWNKLQASTTLDADLEMGNTPYSIDGGTSGLAFDPDNDGTNEITMSTAGGLTAAGPGTFGEINLHDDEFLYLDTAKTNYLGYTTAHGGVLLGGGTVDLCFAEGVALWANTATDATGNWDPYFRMTSSGTSIIENTLQGDEGNKYFRVYMTDGLRLDTGDKDAIIKADNVSTSDKTFQFPNSTGTLLVYSEPTLTGPVEKTITIPAVYLQGTGALTNGTTNTKVTYIDDSPDGEWTGIDGDVVTSTSSTYYKEGTKSLKVVVAEGASAGDTILNPLGGGDEDWQDRESIGVWVYTDTALSGGDFDFRIYDATANTDLDFPAISADIWTWCEIDISGVAAGNKDVITDIAFIYTVDKGAMNIYFDFLAKWDVADETDLTQNILTDGILSVIANPVAAATAMAWVNQTEYTDFFINYASTDNLVVITDESLNCFIMQYAYQ